MPLRGQCGDRFMWLRCHPSSTARPHRRPVEGWDLTGGLEALMSTTNTCRFLPAARVELEVVAHLDVVEAQSQAGHARPSITQSWRVLGNRCGMRGMS